MSDGSDISLASELDRIYKRFFDFVSPACLNMPEAIQTDISRRLVLNPMDYTAFHHAQKIAWDTLETLHLPRYLHSQPRPLRIEKSLFEKWSPTRTTRPTRPPLSIESCAQMKSGNRQQLEPIPSSSADIRSRSQSVSSNLPIRGYSSQPDLFNMSVCSSRISSTTSTCTTAPPSPVRSRMERETIEPSRKSSEKKVVIDNGSFEVELAVSTEEENPRRLRTSSFGKKLHASLDVGSKLSFTRPINGHNTTIQQGV
ncbi:hypothetical protein PROFUN_13483 [Planoprotostelium fungivorum]|uniref:RGS domain-containing protein n=1 Tax=Planoprotostelium fungivorum TaxID=1890364 RepID=A0A2P6N3W8_9EUKA|nr:hypothetical protein PROFUN_13483 [Planoprotostelium fungivorum]